MASKELSERDYDFGGIFGGDTSDHKLALLGKCVEKIELDILTTRNCFDFVLSEIKSENEKILSLIGWNQRRMDLLQDLINKNQMYIDKRENCYKEMIDIIKLCNNVKDITLKTCKINVNELCDKPLK